AVARQQPLIPELGPAGLVEIFRDDAGARHRGVTLLDQDRRGAGGIELEELLPALPYPFLDPPPGAALLRKRQPPRARLPAKRKPQEGRMRAKRMVEQRQHVRCRNAATPRQ